MSEGTDQTNRDEDHEDERLGPDGVFQKWWKELQAVRGSKSQKSFETIGERVTKIYRNASAIEPYNRNTPTPSGRTMYNVLWSNIQVLSPSLYARLPKVVVERRFKDSDPIGRMASQLAERGTQYNLSTQQDSVNFAFKSAVLDRLLPGRGQVWLRFDAEFEDLKDEAGQPVIDPNTEQVLRRPKRNTERVLTDYLDWHDFFHSPSRNWYENRWVSRLSRMTRSELVKRFGEVGNRVKLTHTNDGRRTKSDDEATEFKRQAEVFEIWDKETKRVYWISEGYQEGPLDVKDDPLRLKHFFPCPRPLYATMTPDSSYPTPDYIIYERLADELDYVTKRLAAMVDCVRLVGAVAASASADVKNMLSLNDGQLWPIQNWAQWIEKSGLKGMIDWLPFDQCVNAIGPLMQYQSQLQSQLDLITSMPDIVRGASDPNDPVYSQQAKQHWVTVKLMDKQEDVQRFCREVVSMQAEILFEPGLVSDETIYLMCGVGQMPPDDQQYFQPGLELLRNDILSSFRVDIETDSTIAIDEAENAAKWSQYMQAVQGMVAQVRGVQEYRPELMRPMVESALAAVRALRTGRAVEGAWEKAWAEIEKADEEAKMNPPPPPPDYEAQKIQIQQQELGLQSQELQLKGQEIQLKYQESMSRQQIGALEQQLKEFKAQFEQYAEQQRIEIEKYKTVLSEREKMIEEQRLAQDQRDSEVEKVTARREPKGGSNVNVIVAPQPSL